MSRTTSASTTASTGSSGKVLKDHFAENSDPKHGVSICIPRVFNNINWNRIKKKFIQLRWGYVERVDVIAMGGFKRAFVHFAPGRWNIGDKDATDALIALVAGDEVKIVYDDPWFWKIGISRAKRPDEAPKPKARPVVQITHQGAFPPYSPITPATTPSPKAEESSAPKIRAKPRKLRITKESVSSEGKEEGEVME